MPLTALAVVKRYATLYELQTIYSYEDLMDFYEIISVNSINEDRMFEEIKQDGRRRNH